MEQKGNWKIKKTRIAYQNPWMKVVEDQVIQPDGKEGIYAYVETSPGVLVIPLDTNQNIYLNREFRYAADEESIEGVGGGVEKGESIEEAAYRELEEEAGIKTAKLTKLGVVNAYKSYMKSPAHLFLAEELTFTEQKLEGSEKIEIVKIAFEEALNWIKSGKINHTSTVATLLLIKDLLNKDG